MWRSVPARCQALVVSETPEPRRSSGGVGWFLAGYAGVAGFILLEAATRRRGAASSLDASTDDRGTTRLIVVAYVTAAIAAPLVRMRAAAAASTGRGADRCRHRSGRARPSRVVDAHARTVLFANPPGRTSATRCRSGTVSIRTPSGICGLPHDLDRICTNLAQRSCRRGGRRAPWVRVPQAGRC